MGGNPQTSPEPDVRYLYHAGLARRVAQYDKLTCTLGYRLIVLFNHIVCLCVLVMSLDVCFDLFNKLSLQ